MRLIFILVVILGLSTGIYLFITYFFIHFKELKKINWIALTISGLVGISLISLVGFAIYKGSNAKDTWCTIPKITNAYPPGILATAMDYFEKGNYEYDKGNCDQAVADYTKSIEMDPTYPQAHNNKAFTEMRMGKYNEALGDLNNALAIKPDYVNALINRGDIYNQYEINKEAAIKDYEQVISLIGVHGDRICGRIAMAKHYSGKNPVSFFKVLVNTLNCRNGKPY